LIQLINAHRTTLIFVNTRRLAERLSAALAEHIGEENVTAHHGSLAREHRLDAEQRLKAGTLQALVCTASLELGIDIGDIDLVCQMGSPRSIATFLQRVGRSGHAVEATPKGRLFPLTRDELVESIALLQAIQRDELDQIPIPEQPLDVLTQQIVAEVSNKEWDERELYNIFKKAWPYRELTTETFMQVVQMLSDGFHTRRGRRGAYIYRDGVNHLLRPRRGARLTAILNGGAIPDQFDYDVIIQPEGIFIGNLNEDFAFESLPGDIFQLGNTSYRMLKIEQGKVYVEDAKGQPPNIPFWFGEAPGRTDELSYAVSRFRETIDTKLEQGEQIVTDFLRNELNLSDVAIAQLIAYLATSKAALGKLPTQDRIVLERFFDETQDMHLVIHSPFGSRINKAWGLSLRKRFCRKFNFELQAAATDDNVVLSLGPTHSFELAEVANYLNKNTVRDVLIQALLAAPMFPTRWRWVTNTSLAVPRMRAGKKVPAPFQRNDAEDLVALIFPDQLACLENIAGDREVPDHPLVQQTLKDCLTELMDIDGLINMLVRIEQGEIEILARDLATPSPMAQEILNARPYAFLDDAPAEERRTLAIQQRRGLDPQSAADIGSLNQEVMQTILSQVKPAPRDADELHDALYIFGCLTQHEVKPAWNVWLELLLQQNRVTLLTHGQVKLYVTAERLHEFMPVYPAACYTPNIHALNSSTMTPEHALIELVRSRLELVGPITEQNLADFFDLPETQLQQALLSLEHEGFVIRGHFVSSEPLLQWCERGLLARMHRETVSTLRKSVEPVSPATFMQFLFHWQGLDEPGEGENALLRTLDQLQGLALPATAWEQDILPTRINDYSPFMLDRLCAAGQVSWYRRSVAGKTDSCKKVTTLLKQTPITFSSRMDMPIWLSGIKQEKPTLSGSADTVLNVLQHHGASFFDELVNHSGLLKSHVEMALAELASQGLVTADNFTALRALMQTQATRKKISRRRHALHPVGMSGAGRWNLIKKPNIESNDPYTQIEHIARTLLHRYGVVFRKLLERETNMPSWRDLLYIYRRLEARGEIRGGRFVTEFSGEQFALPEAISTLRKYRNHPDEHIYIISTADPLNLTGVITPGKRISSSHKNYIAYKKGCPTAVMQKNEVEYLSQVSEEAQWDIRNRFERHRTPAYQVNIIGKG
jgi:ATP-dependent Lhr-like helicase